MQRQASLGSDGDVQYVMADDERMKRRRISNRKSARRCRMRKQQHLESLVNQVSELQKQNNETTQRISETFQQLLEVASENSDLRAEAMELTNKLRSLNSVAQIAEEVRGFSMEIPETPDYILQPWRLPYPIQPIMGSTNMFRC